MKLTTTAAGDLQIRVNHGTVWLALLSVALDARSSSGCDLATRVGARITDEQVRADWNEWVEPDLREGFDRQLETVAAAIKAALARKTSLGPGELVIPKADFPVWYGALNQARLALEAKYCLADNPPEEDAEGLDERWHAYLRSQFYSYLQSRLLDLGLG